MLLLIATGSVPEVWRSGRQPCWFEMRSPLARREIAKRFFLPPLSAEIPTAGPSHTTGFATEAATGDPTLADWSRAAARLITLMLAGLAVLLLVAEVPGRLWNQPLVALGELLMLKIVLCGYAVAWQREAVGAMLATAGLGGLLLLEGLVGNTVSMPLTATIATPPLLFLTSSVLRRWEPFDVLP